MEQENVVSHGRRWLRRVLPTAIVLMACGGMVFALYSNAEPQEAPQSVEIQEYEGEKLGSALDFRENSIRGVQTIDPSSYRLVVDGLVEQTASWSYAQIQDMAHEQKLVTIHCVEGWSVRALWDGIPVATLLELARPSHAATTVIFHAVDGYTTSLPLAQILERNLILADRINGITLPPANGFPFQLVAEEKWGYKWIRWVTRIELSDDRDYEGFWERRGYNNDGDVSGPMRGDD